MVLIMPCASIIPMKHAIILAAGQGKRLGKLTSDIPKCLLAIEDKTLLDFSLEALKESSVSDITFVIGHAKEKLIEHVIENWSDDFTFKFVYNEKYADYNNIYSAYLVRNSWTDETILLNSDIIFDKEILLGLKTEAENSCLIIDNTKTLVEEDMKVKVNSTKKITAINKGLNIKDSLGEYIGIFYLKGDERVKFLESLELNVEGVYGRKPLLDLYYEDALDQILDHVSVYPLSTNGKKWTEVDTSEDYELAKKIGKELKEKVAI